MIGEKLGRYTILETVGSGSMGAVYRAQDPEGRPVAIKHVRSRVLYDPGRRERFLQGLLAASEIRHESICPVFEITDDQDDFFIVMPFLQGRTLEQALRRQPIPWQQAIDFSLAAGEALAAIHRHQAVHRGFKPANIWLLADGSIMLSDCCIGRFTEIEVLESDCGSRRAGSADTFIPMGALAYMSPEQIRGEEIDCRSDIFSFGAVLYEMLSGRHPFQACNSLSRMSAILEADPPPLASRIVQVYPELDFIVRKALAKEPSARYQSMPDLLADLAMIRAHASEWPAAARPALISRRRRFPFKLAVLSAALMTAAWIILLFRA